MRLLESIKVSNKRLKNSMVMAPMTWSRASVNGIVGDSTVLYYTQRASAGIINSKAINISKQAIGSPLTPSINTPKQINALKKVLRLFIKKKVLFMLNFGTQVELGIHL